MKEVKTTNKGNVIEVQCSKNWNVINYLRKWGHWENKKQCWLIDSVNEKELNKLLIKYFGTTNGTYKTCSVKIEDYRASATLKPITIGGIEIVNGIYDKKKDDIRLSDDVELLDGKIYKGGSRAYPSSNIDGDIIINDVPVATLNNTPSFKALKRNSEVKIEFEK